jgi:hypothetical protein
VMSRPRLVYSTFLGGCPSCFRSGCRWDPSSGTSSTAPGGLPWRLRDRSTRRRASGRWMGLERSWFRPLG